MQLLPRSDVVSGFVAAKKDAASAAAAASGAGNSAVSAAEDAAKSAAMSAATKAASELKERVIAAVASILKLPHEQVLAALAEMMGNQVLDMLIGQVANAASAVVPVARTAKEAGMVSKSVGLAAWKKHKKVSVASQESRMAEGPSQAALRCVPRFIGRAITQQAIEASRHGTAVAISIPADVLTLLGLAGIPLTFGGSAIIVPLSEALLGYTGSFAVAVAGLVQKLCVLIRDFNEIAAANRYLAHPEQIPDERIFEECPILRVWWLLLASDYELCGMPIDAASDPRDYGNISRLKNWLLQRRDWQQTNIFEWAEHRNVARASAYSVALAYDYALVKSTPEAGSAPAKIEEVQPPMDPAWDDYVFTLLPRRMNLGHYVGERTRQLMSAFSADSLEGVAQGIGDNALEILVPAAGQ